MRSTLSSLVPVWALVWAAACGSSQAPAAAPAVDPVAPAHPAGDKQIDLWTTELRLLHFFMTHPGRVFSRARLLDEVWGEHVFVEERTVDVHIRRLRQALAPTGHDKLIETVRGTGYRFKPDFTTANMAA